MNCEEAREARLDRASGPLEAERERALSEHVARCAKCASYAAEIDDLEARLEDTLSSVGNVEVARRFRPRSRWTPLAAAAAVALAAGAGFWAGRPRVTRPGERLERAGIYALDRAQVALAEGACASVEGPRRVRLEAGRARFSVEPGPFEVEAGRACVEVTGTTGAAPGAGEAELTVEVEEDPMKRNGAVVGASVVVVGVVSGAVLLRMEGGEAAVRAGEIGVARTAAPIQVLRPAEEARARAAAEKKAAALEVALASAQARVAELEKKVAAEEKLAAEAAPAKAAAAQTAKKAPGGDGSADAASADEKVKAIVKKFEWQAGTQALIAWTKAQKTGQPTDPSIYMTLSKMNMVAAEIAKARGYSNPMQAYSDPAVREEFVPAWIDALGANLDATQVDAIKQHVREQIASETGGDDPSYLGGMRDKLASNLDREKFLSTLLRPEQLQGIDATVGDDPFFGSSLSRSVERSSTTDGLVQSVLGEWQRTFELSPQSLAAAQSLAQKYAQEAAAIPDVDPSLDTSARRVANTQRSLQVIDLQQKMEKELAGVPGLTDAERARVTKGAGYILDLQIKK